MKLRSKSAFWPLEAGLLRSYPIFKRDETCQVAIVGAGVTGALVASRLAREGVSCVVVEARDIGGESTAASTALLQYEIDVPLHELIETRGEKDAVRAYRLCWDAIDTIERLAGTLASPCEFRRVPSLYLASRPEDVGGLEKEVAARNRHGFTTAMLSSGEVASRFPFKAPGALWTMQGAEINPYRFAHGLLRDAAARGARVYDRTRVTAYEAHARGVTLRAENGRVIEAERIVFATGYPVPSFLDQKIVRLKSTYAMISEPVADLSGWPGECLIWETARPYLYMRTTPGGRVLVGGEDESFVNAAARDSLIEAKSLKLQKRFAKKFPGIEIDPAYSWAGTFGETKDGLGYIGETSDFPRGFFALGYGGNGMTCSVIAAGIISDLYLGRPNADAAIFRFNR
jgi:glycine/D-amino acid oxidase-like deaminating enzyme